MAENCSEGDCQQLRNKISRMIVRRPFSEALNPLNFLWQSFCNFPRRTYSRFFSCGVPKTLLDLLAILRPANFWIIFVGELDGGKIYPTKLLRGPIVRHPFQGFKSSKSFTAIRLQLPYRIFSKFFSYRFPKPSSGLNKW